MKKLVIVILLAAFVCGGCTALLHGPDVDVEIINHSSHDLEEAKAIFGSFECAWGWVSKNATKGFGFYPHPITENATLRWWEKDRGQQSVALDLRSIYPRGAAGRLTFTISDSGAKASFQKE